jgi:hypothetical protein
VVLVLEKEKRKKDVVVGNKTGQLSLFDTNSMQCYAEKMCEEAVVAELEHRRMDERVQAHRLRIIKLCDERGIALSVIDGDFLEVLEEERKYRLSLGDASNLRRDFGDQLLVQHHSRLQAAHTRPGDVSCLTLDAANHGHTEVLFGVTRVVSSAMKISHHLVLASRYPRPLSAVEYVQADDGKIRNANAVAAVVIAITLLSSREDARIHWRCSSTVSITVPNAIGPTRSHSCGPQRR